MSICQETKKFPSKVGKETVKWVQSNKKQTNSIIYYYQEGLALWL